MMIYNIIQEIIIFYCNTIMYICGKLTHFDLTRHFAYKIFLEGGAKFLCGLYFQSETYGL